MGCGTTPNREVYAVLLSFHKGVGDHCTVLVDIMTHSAIGHQEFKVVHPKAKRLISSNHKARSRYTQYLEGQMSTHRMMEHIAVCKTSITTYPTSCNDRQKMQWLDMQMDEMQRGSKKQSHQIYSMDRPFSKPVQTYHLCCQAYQD
jgi:hypothetical protein